MVLLLMRVKPSNNGKEEISFNTSPNVAGMLAQLINRSSLKTYATKKKGRDDMKKRVGITTAYVAKGEEPAFRELIADFTKKHSLRLAAVRH